MQPTCINLIPIERRQARRRRIHRRAWVGACAFYAVVWVAVFLVARGIVVSDDRALGEQLEDAQGRVAQAKASVTGRRVDLSEARAALEANLAVGRQPDWSVLLALLSTTLGDEVVLRRCRLGPVGGGPAGRAGADEAEERQIIKLELMGLALTQQAVTQVILRLEQTRLFRSVKLIDTRREPFMAGHAVAFRAECVLQTEPQIQETPR